MDYANAEMICLTRLNDYKLGEKNERETKEAIHHEADRIIDITDLIQTKH